MTVSGISTDNVSLMCKVLDIATVVHIGLKSHIINLLRTLTNTLTITHPFSAGGHIKANSQHCLPSSEASKANSVFVG